MHTTIFLTKAKLIMQHFQSLMKYLSLNYASLLSIVFLKKVRLTSYKVCGSWLAFTTANHFKRGYQKVKLDLSFSHDPCVQRPNLQKVKELDLIRHVKNILTSRVWKYFRNISIHRNIYSSRKSVDNRMTLRLTSRQKILSCSTSEKN